MTQDIINIGIALFGAIFGWLLRTIWNAVTSLQNDLKAVEREIHTSYVSKDDFKQDIQEIKYMIKQNNDEVKDIFKQLFEKLDRKADK